MNCTDIPELTSLHLTGELEPARAAEFTNHLRKCSRCAGDVRQQSSLDAELRETVLSEPVDSAALEERVLWNIRAERVGRRRVRLAGLAAAAALVLAIGGAVSYTASLHHNVAAPLFAAAARDHQAEIVLAQPRKWHLDTAAIHDIAGREGVADIDVNALAPSGYRFEEAKLCRLDGRFFLHLVYTDGRGKYSVFLRKESETAGIRSGRIVTSDAGSNHVAGFRVKSVDAMVVTDGSTQSALGLARAISAKI